MKKNACVKSFICIFSLILLGVLFSCGLPVFYLLYPPVNAELPTDISEGRVFRFTTADSLNSTNASEIYLGTDVYYKIYNSKTDCQNDIQSITSINAEFSQVGFNRLQALGYAKLSANPPLPPTSDVLFDNYNNDYKVSIRLFDEGEDNFYPAGFLFENNGLNSNSKPLRSKGSFDFDNNNQPKNGDPDYKYNENSQDESYFVTAFAVSIGRDGFFQPYYSSLLHLGVINIPNKTSN